MTRTFPRRKPYVLVVDPAGCGCTECIIGEYTPADRLTEKQKDFIGDGNYRDGYNDTTPSTSEDVLIDNTGMTEQEWDILLED